MTDEAEYNKIANKLVNIEDKIIEIDKISKIIDIWIKENACEFIPVADMLNCKIEEAIHILRN